MPRASSVSSCAPARLAVVTVSVLTASTLVTGCAATPSGPSPATGGTSTTTGATATDGPSPTRGAIGFPIVVERRGGLAGFDDRLAVTGKGTVTGRTKHGQVQCSVPPEWVVRLVKALARTTETPAPSRPGSDRMHVVVLAGERRLDLGEGAGTDPLSAAVTGLLGDVQLPPAQRRVCR